MASRQHGVVARKQLLELGVTGRAIEVRSLRGSLIAIHRGVYRVGHTAQSVEAMYLAAVLAFGDGAVLCGRAAAYLQKLVRGGPPQPEVLALTYRRVDGVRAHRVGVIHPAERTRARQIPITSVPRTLIDLAATLDESELALACHNAGALHRTTPADVRTLLDLRPNAPGTAKLRSVLHGDVKVSLSRLESRFLALLRQADLPLPVTNRPAGGRRVDCRWPRHRLTVELDSYRYHSSRHAWELDRKRERAAYARGDEHRRYTHDDVFVHPRAMLRELRALLQRPPPASAEGASRRGNQ